VYGTVKLLGDECDLCVDDETNCRSDSDVAAVMRGACSFDMKARNAMRLGYHALIIINHDPEQESFPMGAGDKSFTSNIPVVMMAHGSKEYLSRASTTINMNLDNVKVPTTTRSSGIDGANNSEAGGAKYNAAQITYLLQMLVMGGGFVFLAGTVVVLANPFTVSHKFAHNVAVWLIVILFVAVRMGTFRALETSDGLSSYHHQETDERIFESLVNSVLSDWRAYSLQGTGMIAQLGLSIENYGDAVFIHPPLFVYTLAVLRGVVGLALPASILVMHAAMLFLVRELALIMGQRSEWAATTNDTAGVLAMVVYTCCPLGAFCSQKVWIDNALAFSVTLCAVLQLRLWQPVTASTSAGVDSPATGNSTSSGSPPAAAAKLKPAATASSSPTKSGGSVILSITQRATLSGLMFGALVLNCKVTGLALAPFMVLAMLPRVLLARSSSSSSSSSQQASNLATKGATPWTSEVSAVLLGFLLGAVCAHGPWVWYYHYTTGRWMPNAWPSPSLIAHNKFLQRAVSHPWHYYLSTLLRFSPAACVGLLATALRPVSIWYHKRRLRQASRKTERVAMWCLILAAWPGAFLAGLTLLGVMGAGFQARFALPVVPAACVLTAHHCVAMALLLSRQQAEAAKKEVATASAGGYNVIVVSPSASTEAGLPGGVNLLILALLLIYSSVHVLYYAVLFPNFYADLDLSLFDVVVKTLDAKFSPISTPQCMSEMLVFLKHYGVHLS
jgi:hypothetical protein